MRKQLLIAGTILLAGCSKPAGAPANEQAPVITDLNATAPAPHPWQVGFACIGKEDRDNEKVTRHFVLQDSQLSELSPENGKLENVCEAGFACQNTIDATHIHVSQNITDTTDSQNIRKRVWGININRVTGELTQFDTTTLVLDGKDNPGWHYNFHGSCEKEAPETAIKPKF